MAENGRTQVRGETMPNRETHNRESPFLSGGSASECHHKLSYLRRPNGEIATRASRGQDKELQKISSCISEDRSARRYKRSYNGCVAGPGDSGARPACSR